MRFVTQDDQLTIRLEGFEQLWGLKRRIRIPRSAVDAVDFIPQQPRMQDFEGHLRLPGTSLPWQFLVGSYTRKGEREFWYVHMKQPGVLILTLKPRTAGYDKIRLTCTPQIAQDIADWWQERKTKL